MLGRTWSLSDQSCSKHVQSHWYQFSAHSYLSYGAAKEKQGCQTQIFLNLLEFYWMLSEPPPRVVLFCVFFWGLFVFCFWKKVPWVSIYEESRQKRLRSAATCHVGFALSGAAQNNSFSKLKILRLSSRYCVLEEDSGLAASHLLKTKFKHLFWKKKNTNCKRMGSKQKIQVWIKYKNTNAKYRSETNKFQIILENKRLFCEKLTRRAKQKYHLYKCFKILANAAGHCSTELHTCTQKKR